MTDEIDITSLSLDEVLETSSPAPVQKKRKDKPHGGSVDDQPYKDTQGRYRTLSLFLETIDSDLRDRYQPRFSLKEMDQPLGPNHWYYNAYPEDKPYPGCKPHVVPSMRRLYLEMADPSEYSFAMEILGSDKHWKILQELPWFQPHLAEWRETLDTKLRSEAIQSLRKISQSMDEAKALQAAKWLAEGSYKTRREKGRPSSEEVTGHVVREASVKSLLQEDAERLGLTLDTKPEGNA